MHLPDKILPYLLYILIFTTSYRVYGQTSGYLNKPELEFENNTLTITYSLEFEKFKTYQVGLEVINSSGKEIQGRALKGDIGKNIKPGENKKIFWNLGQDNISINEEISVRIVAKPLHKKLYKQKLLLKSAIWPGWGQTELHEGKPFWLIGFAGVACIGGSYWYNQQSLNNYDKYVDAVSASKSEKYYDRAVQQDNASKILGYSALGIWAANILWIALAKESPNKLADGNINLHLKPEMMGDHNSLSLCLTLSLNP